METLKQINESCTHHNHPEDAHEHSGHCSNTPDGVTSNIHDGALVCSGDRHIACDPELVKKNLEKETGLLDTWVEEQGGITGHIKAIISVNGPVYRISAAGGEVDSRNLQLKNVHVSIVAIVFKVDREAMERRVGSLLGGLAKP